MADPVAVDSLATAAAAYARAGYEVFPLNPDKTPRTRHGMLDATTDVARIEAWWQAWPAALIGCRIPDGVVLLDIDVRHRGGDVWRALKATHGEIPLTRRHLSGRRDGGGHVWFLAPAGRLSVARLVAWAVERGLAQDVGTPGRPKWIAGIDLLQHGHRYTILPPSPHAETGLPYEWRGDAGTPILPMPEWLADLLTEPEPQVNGIAVDLLLRPNRPAPSDSDSIADWYTASTTWADLLAPRGWTLVRGDGDGDGSLWRHPSATASYSASVKHGCLFSYTPNSPFDETVPGDVHGYTRFRAWAVLDHGGDLSAAAYSARERKDGPILSVDLEGLIAPSANGTAPVASLRDLAHLHLPAEFWTARPIFEHIREAARSRLVAPDAVFGSLLTRIAACTPHTVEIPAIVGSPIGLTFYVGVVGPPEAGKSAAAALAAELLPAPPAVLDRLPMGTGEGMVEVMFEYVEEEDAKGKKTKVKRQIHFAAIFHVDEGAVLSDLGNRSGATLLPNLRTAFSHGTLGNTNASIERRRILDGRLYVYGITIGIQPELAGPLLGDAAAGTPQRFVWLMATDPEAKAERPDWPGAITWTPPTPRALEHQAIQRGGWLRHQLAVDEQIRTEVVADRVGAMRGEERDPGDAHRTLVRLKVAALLAVLDGRLGLDMEDWRLAGIVVDTSKRIRLAVQTTLVTVERRKEASTTAKLARREVFVEESKEARALASAAKSVARVVARHTVAKTHAARGGGCVRSCCTQAMSGKHKAVLTPDDAIDEAVAKDWIRVDGEHLVPGESRPA